MVRTPDLMKININYFTECFPVHEIYHGRDSWDNSYDVDLETLKRWKKASEDFMSFQKEVYNLINENKPKLLKDQLPWEGWNPMEIDLEDSD